MAKTVFILGAGASKQAGAPLMAEFLDTAKHLNTNGVITQDADTYGAFSRVFQAIRELRISHYKSYIDLDDIEAVFGAFEMGRLIKRIGNRSVEDIEQLIASLKTLIVKTLEFTMLYKPSLEPLYPYLNFAQLLSDLRAKRGNDACSVLTFNYDTALEYALLKEQLAVDYSLSLDSTNGKFKLLKLHGSLNWGRCPSCESVVPVHIAEHMRKEGFMLIGDVAVLKTASNLVNHKHQDCGVPLEPSPVLVPPTWNKTEYHGQLGQVWSQAARELSEANNIIVIGYSHPISDQFFKYLFSLGSIGDADIKRFWVFDPVPENGPVAAAYRKLVGTGIQNRFQYFPKKFGASIGDLRRCLL